MDKLDKVTIIAVCVLMTVLFGLIQISVWPLNKRMDRIEGKIDQSLYELKNHFHSKQYWVGSSSTALTYMN